MRKGLEMTTPTQQEAIKLAREKIAYIERHSAAAGSLLMEAHGYLAGKWIGALDDALVHADIAYKAATEALAALDAVKEPEPSHWRAVLVNEIPDGVPVPTPRIAGFQYKKEAEQFIAERKDFKGWEYRLEPLYAAPPMNSEPVQLPLTVDLKSEEAK